MNRLQTIRPAATLLALANLVGAGARADRSSALTGYVPERSIQVGALSLPEVHAGRPAQAFHFKAAAGHTLFVYFGYTTCPDVCPATLSDLKHALRALGDGAKRVDVAFITVDPDRDLPQVIEPYIASFVKGAHPLRPGSRQQLEPVQRAFGAGSSVSRDSSGIVHVSHTSTSYLVDEHGRVVEEWSFGTTPDAMTADLRVLLGPARY